MFSLESYSISLNIDPVLPRTTLAVTALLKNKYSQTKELVKYILNGYNATFSLNKILY